jgi:cellulose synthase/poly-beta-1,6-N-acetylglucosamine synthase-like glycosyltransferase
MRIVFWSSALFIVYVYAGYALLLMLWVRIGRPAKAGRYGSTADDDDSRRGVRLQPDAHRLPRVSIVIAARDEAKRLPARIANLLAVDYPAERREIIVVSDGSADRTRDALASFRKEVTLLELPASGKAVALNAGAAHATGDILVFTDARQSFAEDALLELTAPFRDPAVGGVSGELILGAESTAGRRSCADRRENDFEWRDHERRTMDRRSSSTVGDGVGFYWRYEKHLRRLESEVGSMLGATGAIYALRRSLWKPLPAGTILDDVLAPMRAVLDGSRVVFAPQAHAFDYTSKDADAETRRKIRTLAGNVQILWFEPRLLVPFRNPVWLQYVSHKIGRLLVPYALVALFASSLVLFHTSTLYALALLAQAAFYLHGGYGAWVEHWDRAAGRRRSLVQRTGAVAFTIVAMNVSAVAGVGAALLGRKVWK